MSLHVLGVVPARGGSRRLPGKNLAEIEGRTLVGRALDNLLAATRVGVVALSSDDEAILAEGAALREVELVRRPAELATSLANSHSAVVHALQEVEERTGAHFDAVALVQCTSPFTEPGDIDGALELMERTGAGAVFSVCQLDHVYHPEKLRTLEGDRLVPYVSENQLPASHEMPALWVTNGSVYASRRETVDAGSLVSEDLCAYRMPEERSLDINTLRDLEFARFLAERSHAAASPSPRSAR